MSDRVEFVRQILADPADDTVRLVFADWLEEYGGDPERAAFIRVQVGTGLSLSAADVMTGEDRAAAAPLVPFKGCAGWVYRRGFLEELTCTAEEWLAHAPWLHWHPGAVVACGRCGGTGKRADGPAAGAMCLRCGGTGTRPVPCLGTAHPITRVNLTTAPGLLLHGPWPGEPHGVNWVSVRWGLNARDFYVPFGGDWQQAAVDAFAAEFWPGVKVTLLPPGELTLRARRFAANVRVPNELAAETPGSLEAALGRFTGEWWADDSAGNAAAPPV